MIYSRLFWGCVFLFVGYLAINTVVPNEDMILAQRVLQAAAAAVVCYVYWPDAVAALRARKPSKGDYLIFGIWLGWASTFCAAMLSVVFRISGNPMWLINADPVGLYIAMSVLSAGMHVIAPGAFSGTIPARNRIAAGTGLGCAIVVVLFLLAVRPDLGEVVEKLKPYLSDLLTTRRLV